MKRNIIWATGSYAGLGEYYRDSGQITVLALQKMGRDSIQPRILKAQEEQQQRTRKHGEVQTPAWICCRMNDFLDEAWFERENVFCAQEGQNWVPTPGKIVFPKYRHYSWKQYIDSRRLEITCGEAPFIVSRYDAATGEEIPIERRIGLLDRKLRIVTENAEDEQEWVKWAIRAIESVYGYEYQGDNLLIARINVLMTFVEYLRAMWHRAPTEQELRTVANVVAWNFWQMDGLTGTVPTGKLQAPEPDVVPITMESLGWFDKIDGPTHTSLLKEADSTPPCRVCNWRQAHTVTFNALTQRGRDVRNMKFDYVIGNPPYQESDGGNNASAVPVYQKFINEAIKIQDKGLVMIIPARWYSGGRGLDDFRKSMLNDTHIKCLVDYVNADECFPGVDISGGICYFLRDTSYDGPCKVINVLNGVSNTKERPLNQFDIFIRSNMSVDIVKRVTDFGSDMMYAFVSSQKPFGLRTYVKPEPKGDLVLRWNGGRGKYPSQKVTAGMEKIEKWNVIVSRVFFEHGGKVDKNGQNRVLSILEILKPKEVCTETYIVIHSFDDEQSALNLEKYLKSKFARFLILQASSSIMITKNSFIFVPVQDFTPASDIDWSQSIADIDRQLYRKYALTDEEIAFIESHVKEMT